MDAWAWVDLVGNTSLDPAVDKAQVQQE